MWVFFPNVITPQQPKANESLTAGYFMQTGFSDAAASIPFGGPGGGDPFQL